MKQELYDYKMNWKHYSIIFLVCLLMNALVFYVGFNYGTTKANVYHERLVITEQDGVLSPYDIPMLKTNAYKTVCVTAEQYNTTFDGISSEVSSAHKCGIVAK